jgi:hypothetical protein
MKTTTTTIILACIILAGSGFFFKDYFKNKIDPARIHIRPDLFPSNFSKNIKVRKIKRISEELKTNESFENYMKRSIVYLELKEYEKSLNDAIAANNLEKNDFSVLFMAGYNCFMLGKDEEAEKYLEAAKKVMKYEDEKGKINELAKSGLIKMIESLKQKKISEETLEPQWVNVKDGEKCLYLNRFPKKNLKFSWKGDCVDGYAEGEGIMISDDKYFIHGTMKKGEREGIATLTSNGKDILLFAKCNEVKGYCEGEGEIVLSDRKYIGTFRKDKFHGNTTVIFSDGAKYVGKYENDRPMEGYKAYCPNGDSTEYFIIRGLENGDWHINFNCDE